MDMGWKIASAGATAAATFLAAKATNAGWKLATGNEAPAVDDDEVPSTQVVVFAAVAAVVATLAQRYATRGAKKWYGPRLNK